MQRVPFGRRTTPVTAGPTCLSRILIPQGAAQADDDWSMGEALHLFISDAVERSLFTLDELPAEAVAVFRAYELGNELSNITLASWFSTFGTDPTRVQQTHQGLETIGALSLARDFETIRQGETTQISPVDEQAVVGQCSAWVRRWSGTMVLGDGNHDEHYKRVMRELARCNPAYGERWSTLNAHRAGRNLAPVTRIEGSPTNLDELIAEMRG